MQNDLTYSIQLERTLALWKIGAITRDVVVNATGKAFTSGNMNMVPGAEDLIPFNEANWGEVTRQFLNSTYNLKAKSWDTIFKEAEKFVNGGQGIPSDVVSGAGKRGQFQDLSDDECK
jgi:hypothetical protein